MPLVEQEDKIDLDKPILMITSLFHAREVATLQMNMYIYTKLLYLLYHNCTQTRYLLETS